MANQSLLTKLPENTNTLQVNKHIFTFPNMPFLRYFIQSVNLPGVSTNAVMVPTQFNPTFRHGDTLAYEPLTITALIDEDLRTWEETYDWLRALTAPTKWAEYIKNKGWPNQAEPYMDGILTLNTNANLPNIRIKFTNCHPTSLSPIQFNTFDSAENTPTCSITFQYDYYTIERLR